RRDGHSALGSDRSRPSRRPSLPLDDAGIRRRRQGGAVCGDAAGGGGGHPGGDPERSLTRRMYILNVKSHYDSAHFLRDYHGKCERLHGHRYVVEAGLAFEELGPGGMAYDFSEAKQKLRDIAGELDHQNLNDLPAFADQESSAENQARYIF